MDHYSRTPSRDPRPPSQNPKSPAVALATPANPADSTPPPHAPTTPHTPTSPSRDLGTPTHDLTTPSHNERDTQATHNDSGERNVSITIDDHPTRMYEPKVRVHEAPKSDFHFGALDGTPYTFGTAMKQEPLATHAILRPPLLPKVEPVRGNISTSLETFRPYQFFGEFPLQNSHDEPSFSREHGELTEQDSAESHPEAHTVTVPEDGMSSPPSPSCLGFEDKHSNYLPNLAASLPIKSPGLHEIDMVGLNMDRLLMTSDKMPQPPPLDSSVIPGSSHQQSSNDGQMRDETDTEHSFSSRYVPGASPMFPGQMLFSQIAPGVESTEHLRPPNPYSGPQGLPMFDTGRLRDDHDVATKDYEMLERERQEEGYRCYECLKQFSTAGNLNQHMKLHNPNIPKLSCKSCGKMFAKKHNLQIHAKTHHKVQPFQCSICQRKFSRKGNLLRHVNSIHTQEKQYQCEVCGKLFNDPSNCVKHRRNQHKDCPVKKSPKLSPRGPHPF